MSGARLDVLRCWDALGDTTIAETRSYLANASASVRELFASIEQDVELELELGPRPRGSR